MSSDVATNQGVVSTSMHKPILYCRDWFDQIINHHGSYSFSLGAETFGVEDQVFEC